MIWILGPLVLAQEPAPDATVEPELDLSTLAPIDIDRTWEQLSGQGTEREQLAEAAVAMGDWTVQLAGVDLNQTVLQRWADTPQGEPLVRAIREETQRAVDVTDLLYFLDDVLVAGADGRRGEPFAVHAGRARSAGVLLHTDDVFRAKPRVYGTQKKKQISVSTPAPQAVYEPAQDGELLGPRWTGRFQNPTEHGELLTALALENPGSDFAARIESMLRQLQFQGADVYLTSTVRSKHRGYLMWGAFVLSKCADAACVDDNVAMLQDRDQAWGLDTPIVWSHPDGWQATQAAALEMAEAYDVVYATEKGARSSNHYGGSAADVVVLGLPRTVTLHAPDGETGTFDLSGAEHARDLSLEPELIRWIEKHFGFRKLTGDYPHWDDAR